jgi:HD-GYP domain-containing protein (c-di-GMP phosphodiesterase class II)/ribonuclease BN (tRNA processing enzyme)
MEYLSMLKNDIRFLGVGGSRKNRIGTTCVQVAEDIVIDAGNIINGLGNDAYKIEHIFLTHSHLDHIVDIAFFVDNYYYMMQKPLKIYALKETIEALKEHLFNDVIWPNFPDINLANVAMPTVEYIELEYDKSYQFETVTLTPIAVSHTVPTCAFIIKKPKFSTLFATDTYITRTMWETLDLHEEIESLIIDVSFSSSYEKLAYDSKHLTPKLLAEELEKLNRSVDLYITHIKPSLAAKVIQELWDYGLLAGRNRVLKDGEYLKSIEKNVDSNESVMQISTALSKEKDLTKILEMILKEAISYTDSEGGTIYLKEGDKLHFKSLINKKLDIHVNNPKFPHINLYFNGKENSENVSAVVALKKRIINVPDVYLYNMDGFSFDGVKKFDKANHYRTKSMLVIPMINQDDEVVGVVQLINKKSDNQYIPFQQSDIDMTTTYTNWAASAITKNKLVDDLEALLLSFLESISVALSAKSPYGYGHIARVAELMKVISQKIDEDETIFKDKHYSKEALKELEVAAWMHDVGKIATPEYILDKSTKLETIYDRIGEIRARFNYLKSALKSKMLEEKIVCMQKRKKRDIDAIEAAYYQEVEALEADFAFIERINQPDNGCLSKEEVERIEKIAQKRYDIEDETVMLLTADEAENLAIIKGTLTDKERLKINEHAKISNDMLDMLTFPKKFSRVKEIAAAHHEKLNGTGYPQGLKEDEISFEGRLMAIVDIFEALTSNDRPYKQPKTIEETFSILKEMANNHELDKEIIEFLEKSKAYEPYAKAYLLKEQYMKEELVEA